MERLTSVMNDAYIPVCTYGPAEHGSSVQSRGYMLDIFALILRTEPEKITYSKLTNDRNEGKAEIQKDILYKVISQSTSLSKKL
jgi:hypothetical protein